MKVLVVCLLFIFLTSCDDTEVWFETSQPEGKRELSTFPKRLQGKYKSCFQTKVLMIEEDKMKLFTRLQLRSHIDDLKIDPSENINKKDTNQLKRRLEEEGWTIFINNDTIYGEVTMTQTLFKISDKNVLKKFRGGYFLNEKQMENSWQVSRLELKKDSLFIGKITPSDSLLSFDFISKMEHDSLRSSNYLVKSNKKELNKLLKTDHFSRTECFCKIKNV